MSDYIIVNGELYHYGVKGQKWGVRRYQNADGSLTPAGKKRLDKKIRKTERALDNFERHEARSNVLLKKAKRLEAEGKTIRKGITVGPSTSKDYYDMYNTSRNITKIELEEFMNKKWSTIVDSKEYSDGKAYVERLLSLQPDESRIREYELKYEREL